jgi:hypothetical protein
VSRPHATRPRATHARGARRASAHSGGAVAPTDVLVDEHAAAQAEVPGARRPPIRPGLASAARSAADDPRRARDAVAAKICRCAPQNAKEHQRRMATPDAMPHGKSSKERVRHVENEFAQDKSWWSDRRNSSRFHKSLSLRRHFILLPDSQPSRHPRSRRVSARGGGRGGLGLGASASNGAKRIEREVVCARARGRRRHSLLASPVPLSFSLALRLGTGFGAAAAGGGETGGLPLRDSGGSARTRCRAWCPRLLLFPRALRRVQGRVQERGGQCCVLMLQALLRLCWQGFRPAVVWLVLPTPAADAVCLGARQDVSRIRPCVG